MNRPYIGKSRQAAQVRMEDHGAGRSGLRVKRGTVYRDPAVGAGVDEIGCRPMPSVQRDLSGHGAIASLDERLAAPAKNDKARADFDSRQPTGRIGAAEEFAALAVYLAGTNNTTGQAAAIDGGGRSRRKFAPWT